MIFFISHWGEIPPIGIKLEQSATATAHCFFYRDFDRDLGSRPGFQRNSSIDWRVEASYKLPTDHTDMSEQLLRQVDDLRNAASQEWEAAQREIENLRGQIRARDHYIESLHQIIRTNQDKKEALRDFVNEDRAEIEATMRTNRLNAGVASPGRLDEPRRQPREANGRFGRK